MGKTRQTCDVFVAYSATDAKLAADIAGVLQSFDLSVFFDRNALPRGERFEDAIWEAMAESQAFVIVVSQAAPSASTVFELGAAQGWNKPVYVVVTDPASMQLPSYLHGFPVYPYSRIEDIAREIKGASAPLSESESSLLIQEYNRIGETVDQLLLQPALLAKLARQFKRRAKRQVAQEELLRTLLRLRKRGDLPTTAKKSRSKAVK
jgi:nucleoside 2-deoxyribosyltransferase